MSWSLLELMSYELVMPSNHLILCSTLLLLLSIFPSIAIFPNDHLFPSGAQSIRASASVSVLPMNTQNWSPLGWTGWISLQSKGLSSVFSNTIVWRHQFFRAQPFSLSTSHIYTWLQERWSHLAYDCPYSQSYSLSVCVPLIVCVCLSLCVHTVRDTHTDKHTHSERHTHWETHTYWETHTQTNTPRRERHTHWETHTQTDKHTQMWETHTLRDTHTDRQTHPDVRDTHTERHTHTQWETHTENHCLSWS